MKITFYFLPIVLLFFSTQTRAQTKRSPQIVGKTWIGLGPAFESNSGTYGLSGQVERSWQIGIRNSVGVAFYGYYSIVIQDDRHRDIPNKREYVSHLSFEPYAKFPLYGPTRRGGFFLLGGPILIDEFSQMIVYSQRDNQGQVIDWRYQYDDQPLWVSLRLSTGYEWKAASSKLCRVELGIRGNKALTEPKCVNISFLYGF